MNMDIFVGIMCVLFAVAGIWVWWLERSGSDNKSDDTITEDKDKNA